MVGSPLRLAALVTAGLLALLVATGGGGNGALRAARLRGATTSPGAAAATGRRRLIARVETLDGAIDAATDAGRRLIAKVNTAFRPGRRGGALPKDRLGYGIADRSTFGDIPIRRKSASITGTLDGFGGTRRPIKGAYDGRRPKTRRDDARSG